jgi:sulfatase maturation enzyme AslB (radical SAM superfamily)
MTFEVAKKFIDSLLNNEIKDFTTENTGGISVEFIGGEPLMEIKLITEIWEYLVTELIKKKHPWRHHLRGSICTNGLLYFSHEFQDFL